jgi:hypothetical protein
MIRPSRFIQISYRGVNTFHRLARLTASVNDGAPATLVAASASPAA